MRRRTFLLGLPMTYVAFISGAAVDPCLVVLLDHMDALPLVNVAPYPVTPLTTNYAIDTAINKFGTGSLKSTGTVGQQIVDLTGQPGGGIELTNGDVTIEFQFRRSGGSGTPGIDLWQYYIFLDMASYGWIQFTIFSNSGGGNHQGFRIEVNDGTNYDELIAQEYPLGDSNFHACSATISSNVARIFMDGTQIGSATLAYSMAGQRLTTIFYGDVVSDERVDETRVMLNRAQYTASYTPATGPWVDATCDSGVALGRTIFEAENNSAAETVTGTPVTKRASFMSFLTVSGAEDWESRTVLANVHGMTSTVNGVGLTHTFTNAGSNGKIRNAVPSNGRFNTTTSGAKWADFNTGTSPNVSVYRIAFGTPVSAFGFYGTDMGDFLGQMKVTLKLTGGSTVDINITHTINGNDGSLLFWGFIDQTNTYDYVEISGDLFGEGYGIDDIVVATAAQLA